MSVNKDVAVLYEELGKSNDILDRIEGIVSKFQTKLGKIADDVSKLQDKSKNYTIALNNRRELVKELHEFLDGILLTPQLVKDLIQNEVDLKYIESLDEFSKILKNVESVVSSNKDPSQSRAILDVMSEIERLTIQVCHKIRNFMVTRFYALHKDKTNFQIVQQNSLIRFKALNQFLRNHSQEKYVELTNSYADYMSKRYYHDLRDYCIETAKLVQEKITKNDVVIIDEYKYKTMATDNDVFELEERESILGDIN
jgi:vacuolar protein sorting-associated protein 52